MLLHVRGTGGAFDEARWRHTHGLPPAGPLITPDEAEDGASPYAE
jgi:hypothetical protein